MNNLNNIHIESNEKSYLKLLKKTKHDTFKQNIKSNQTKILIILYFSVVMLVIYLIYSITDLLNIIHQLKVQNSNSYKNNKNLKNKPISFNGILEPYITALKDFCENQNNYINTKYEKELILYNAKYKEFEFQLYVFNSSNFLLNALKIYGTFEFGVSNNMIKALKEYSTKNNIFNNKDIFMLDIGGNVGWYPSLLGRYGYSIISFEAFEKNYYVEKKNICLMNNNSNIVLVTKGLGNEEKNCQYFVHKNNSGNGMVICDNKEILNNTRLGKTFVKESEVQITTLNSFIPYLSNKNIALMKLDVEGNELKILKGGSELITKYHIPFVVLEFSPTYLKEVGSEPKELAQFFVDNGYKISINGFFSKNYITVDELIAKSGFQIILFG